MEVTRVKWSAILLVFDVQAYRMYDRDSCIPLCPPLSQRHPAVSRSPLLDALPLASFAFLSIIHVHDLNKRHVH